MLNGKAVRDCSIFTALTTKKSLTNGSLVGATEINSRAPKVNHQEPLPPAKILCREDFVAL